MSKGSGAHRFLTLPGVSWIFESAIVFPGAELLSYEDRSFDEVVQACPFDGEMCDSVLVHEYGELVCEDVFDAIEEHGGLRVDGTWLDLCGPPRLEWIPLLQAQMDASSVFFSLTVQRARALGDTQEDIFTKGGTLQWLTHYLGRPDHHLEYRDTVPMTQATWRTS